MSATTITQKEEFINLYLDNLDLITENSDDILNHARQEAIENFKLLGFPGLKNEKYKYLKVEPLFRSDF